jgi:hypothetical protein
MAPLKTKTITSRTDAEWNNEQIREAKQGRRRAERRWRGSQLQVDKEIFIEHRHKVNELIDVSKRDHYRNLITSCSDSKQLFRVLNQLLGRKREAQPPEKTPLVLAEMFSQFFIEKISDIRDSIPDANDPTPPFPSPACSFTQFAPVSVTDVLKLIASSPTKSCSLDPLPTELIKANKNELAPAICSIINTSLSNGVFPAVYKNALVRPLIKKPNLDAEIPKNYRPVSNLSFTSKLLEKVVASQLNAYLSQNDLQESQQSAYRCAHNTETALVHLFDDVVRSIGTHQAVLFVALDLSAAFDTVDYVLLEEALTRLGVQGTAAAWLRSYLHDREQQVVIKDAASHRQKLDCGVPQGSVLGPLLFTLYTASLGRVLRHHCVRFHFYADDTQVWLPFRPEKIADVLAIMQQCLLDIQKWMSYHKLKMNCNKTEYLVLSSRHDARAYDLQRSIVIGGESISPSPTPVRNLCALVDSTLSLYGSFYYACVQSVLFLYS